MPHLFSPFSAPQSWNVPTSAGGVSRLASPARAVPRARLLGQPLRMAGPSVMDDSTRRPAKKWQEQNPTPRRDLGQFSHRVTARPAGADGRAFGRARAVGFNSTVLRPSFFLACVALSLAVARPCAAAAPVVALQTQAALRADQRTVLFRLGDRVIAHQPDVDHGRVMQVLGGDAVRTLTVGLGSAGVDENGRANFEIRAAAAAANGEALLYVVPLGRADVGGLWRWRPGGEAARRVIADRDVAQVTGIGPQLPLAEVQMAAAGGDVWVLLRTPDAAVACRLDARRLDNGPRLVRAFDRVTDGGATLRVERQDVWSGRPDGGIGGGPGGGLTLFRPSGGEAWRVDAAGQATGLTAAETGETPTQSPRPIATVPPLDVLVGGRSQVLRFYPDAPRTPDQPAEEVRYPLLLIGGGKDEVVIDRDALRVRPVFPVHGLRLTAWCVDAAGYVMGYDAMSGEVFRLNPSGS